MGPSRRIASFCLIIASLVLAHCGRGTQPSSSDPKIVGGRVADQHPFMASLTDESSEDSFCGGSFIAPRVVVTAAHCVTGQALPLFVSAGVRLNSDQQTTKKIAVEAVSIHPDYNQINDIALLFLEDYDASTLPGPLAMIGLNTETDFPTAGHDSVTVIGWGNTTSYGRLFDDELREVTLPVVPLAQCRSTSGYNTVTDHEICAGDFDAGGRDSCQGDSGGPLIATRNGTPTLVGIVSWGDGCALSRKMGVYTRVSSYADWIKAEIERFEHAPDTLSGEELTALQRGYCYMPLSQEETSRSGSSQLAIQRQRFAVGSFAPVDQATANSESVSNAGKTCKFKLRNGRSFKAKAAKSGGVLLQEIDANNSQQASTQHWWLATARENNTVEMHCSSASISVSTDTHAFNYAVKNGVFYEAVAMPASSQDAGAGAGANIPDLCKVGESAFKIIPAGNQAQADVTSLLVVRSPALGAQAQVYQLIEGADAPRSTPIKVKLTADANALMGSRGTLNVQNTMAEDLHTWELRCNKKFKLSDSTTSVVYTPVVRQANEPDQQDDDGGRHETMYLFRFSRPDSPYGTIRAGTSVSFKYEVTSPSALNGLRCNINGNDVEVKLENQ